MSELERQALEAREVVQEFVDKQGHDKCHYYPGLCQGFWRKPRTLVRG